MDFQAMIEQAKAQVNEWLRQAQVFINDFLKMAEAYFKSLDQWEQIAWGGNGLGVLLMLIGIIFW